MSSITLSGTFSRYSMEKETVNIRYGNGYLTGVVRLYGPNHGRGFHADVELTSWNGLSWWAHVDLTQISRGGGIEQKLLPVGNNPINNLMIRFSGFEVDWKSPGNTLETRTYQIQCSLGER
jgi:hypothetical protein